MKKDVSIQIIRIIAMISIILCHLVQEVNNKYFLMFAQFLNVGVFIFLIISGYLYGKKEIKNPAEWIKKRFIKLMIPIYIFLIPVFLIYFYEDIFQIKYIFIHIFNLQRIFGTGIGLGHLWFMTILMFCYLLTPLLIKYKKKIVQDKRVIVTSVIVSAIICFINKELGQILLYMSAYLVGFCYRNAKKIVIKYKVAIPTVFTILAIRIISKILCDGSILYNQIIVSITQCAIGFIIILIIQKWTKDYQIKGNSIINYFDDLSYYIYICHYIFIVGPIKILNKTHLLQSIIWFVILTYIVALILKYISENITKNIIQNKRARKINISNSLIGEG